MDYREGYLELLAERSGLKAKNKGLFAALEQIRTVANEPFDGSTNFSSDKLKAIDELAREAIANTKGGE